MLENAMDGIPIQIREKTAKIRQSTLPDHLATKGSSSIPRHTAAIRTARSFGRSTDDKERLRQTLANKRVREMMDTSPDDRESASLRTWMRHDDESGNPLFIISGREKTVGKTEAGREQGFVYVYAEDMERVARLIQKFPELNLPKDVLIVAPSFAKFPKAKSGQVEGALHQALVQIVDMYESAQNRAKKDKKTHSETQPYPPMSIVATVAPDNKSSIRVLEKNGFKDIGEMVYDPGDPKSVEHPDRVMILDFNKLYPWGDAGIGDVDINTQSEQQLQKKPRLFIQ